MTWQPIDTAPKDQRFLAAYLTRDEAWMCEVCAWHLFAPAVTSTWKVFPATHWMPLPPPPKTPA